MKKLTKFLINLTSVGSIVLIATLNASQFAVVGQPTPQVDGKPITQSGGPRFSQPTEDNQSPIDGDSGKVTRKATPCEKGKIKLTPLVPKNKIGRTVSEYPVFFFYLPQTDAKQAEFILEDENRQQIYQTTLNINNSSGVIRVSIPTNKNVSPLQIDKNYTWSIALICDDIDRSADVLEKGIVRRVELSADIRSQLQKADPRLKAVIYAQTGIWQDALSTLVAARLANPNDADLAADWKILLDSVNLGEIVAEPIAPIEPQP
ncbi:MAG: DUF928 domain-containing protein [Tychonema bourrellyi B0820]|uniref:DUF928 domain-containing protein n=1 Tax=Tychonema bourrellyi FEM_GT703 TaxID=2040638 RepID=A0A2G4EUZ6_9CYAN|nr:DUF928 domain-containing protein [Tychonema bourrellyi]MDQ2099432.1 DUF928 domain-containing protein [Tychonema bourrellyi B0820]PHX53286.1 DUF928 domain-containing protein [Tychonema bourrellyi FEM_GT703]